MKTFRCSHLLFLSKLLLLKKVSPHISRKNLEGFCLIGWLLELDWVRF